MNKILTWLDRFGLVITLIGFSYSIAKVFGGFEVPSLQISEGRASFLALFFFEVSFALAATAIAVPIYHAFKNVMLAGMPSIFIWSFINVDIMRLMFGDDVWDVEKQGWWIFSTNRVVNAYGNNMAILGCGIFLLSFYTIYLLRMSSKKFYTGEFGTRMIGRLNAGMALLIYAMYGFFFHKFWLYLDDSVRYPL